MTDRPTASATKPLIFKWIMRRDPTARLFRIFRIVRQTDEDFDGTNYSWKFTVAFAPRLFSARKELNGWIFCLAGIRIHFRKSFGGNFS